VTFLEAAAAVDRFLLRVNRPVQYTVIAATVLHMIAVAIPNVPRAYVDYARFPLLSGVHQPDTYGTDTIGNSYVARVVLNDPLDMYTKARLEQTPLEKATWAGAIDNLGGDVLAWLLATSKIAGTVAAVGLAADMKLNTTVAPFILRGVHLLGTDSANCPMSLRQTLWNKLAVDWRPDRVHDEVRTIDFDELPTHFDAYLKGMARGRTVVRVGMDSHP